MVFDNRGEYVGLRGRPNRRRVKKTAKKRSSETSILHQILLI
jgi:hypothetical protein